MSSSFRERDAPPEVKEERVVKGSPPAPFPTWLDRMQNVRARHEAITRSLNTWSNYKNWAERMRSTWTEDSPEAGAAPHTAKGPRTPNH
ncbi:MAG: hypothetical protein ACYCUE_09525 [Steroidobacteraceae bacterium]